MKEEHIFDDGEMFTLDELDALVKFITAIEEEQVKQISVQQHS